MIVVPYCGGAATPSQIAMACEERGQDTVFVVDPSDTEVAPQIRLLEAFGEVVEAGDPAEAIRGLESYRPAGVVIFAEANLPTAAAVAAHFGLPGHSPEIIGRLTDKGIQRRRLNACHVGAVRTADVHGGQTAEQLGDIPLPGVLKPAQGAGSRDTVFVHSAAEVVDELARQPEQARFVVEELIVGVVSPIHPGIADYMSVESAVIGGDVVHLGCTGRLPPAEPARERALIVPIAPEPALLQQLQELASAAIDALEIRFGMVHTEIKIGSDGPRVMEVNSRIGGGIGSLLAALDGPDLIGLSIDLAMGTARPEAITTDGVGMHLYIQPPLGATRFLAAPDARELRSLPGVFGADARARPGDAIDWRVGSIGRVFDVWLRAPTLDGLLAHAYDVETAVLAACEWGYA